MQRLINREKRQPVVSTKAQIAMNEIREQAKAANKSQKRRKKLSMLTNGFNKSKPKNARSTKDINKKQPKSSQIWAVSC